MNFCTFCKKKALYQSILPIVRRNRPHYYTQYCEQHKGEGLEFGWAEESEIEKIK